MSKLLCSRPRAAAAAESTPTGGVATAAKQAEAILTYVKRFQIRRYDSRFNDTNSIPDSMKQYIATSTINIKSYTGQPVLTVLF
jgi:hypothetical protein